MKCINNKIIINKKERKKLYKTLMIIENFCKNNKNDCENCHFFIKENLLYKCSLEKFSDLFNNMKLKKRKNKNA